MMLYLAKIQIYWQRNFKGIYYSVLQDISVPGFQIFDEAQPL